MISDKMAGVAAAVWFEDPFGSLVSNRTERMRRALEAADRAAWSDDINAAPKDGTPILVHGAEIDTRIVAFEAGHDAFPWAETIGGSCFPSELIQWWRPLSEPPR